MGNDTRTVQRRRDVLLVLRREYQKAYARTEGVEDVDVSLAHEGGPRPVRRRHSERSQGEGHTPRSGYTIRDPDKAKRYEQQQAELADGKQRLLLAGGASVVVAALMGWMIFVVGRFESASLAMDIAALARWHSGRCSAPAGTSRRKPSRVSAEVFSTNMSS